MVKLKIVMRSKKNVEGCTHARTHAHAHTHTFTEQKPGCS